jgi:hypothetical protein
MYCIQCGTWNDKDSEFCTACGNALPVADPAVSAVNQEKGSYIPAYLLESIVILLYFPWVFGIAALVNSRRVSANLFSGDMEAARKASNATLTWLNYGFIIGTVFYMLILTIASHVLMSLMRELSP